MIMIKLFKKLYNDWFALPPKTRFYISGIANFVFSFLLFMLLVTFLGYRLYRLCVFLQWFIPSLAVYLIQKYFVFKTKGDVIYEYLKYSATWFFCFICNVAILEFFIMTVTKNVYWAQFFAYVVVTILSYFIFKNLAFFKKNE